MAHVPLPFAVLSLVWEGDCKVGSTYGSVHLWELPLKVKFAFSKRILIEMCVKQLLTRILHCIRKYIYGGLCLFHGELENTTWLLWSWIL